MRYELSFVVALAVSTAFLLANEPNWTDAERADGLNDRADLYRAVVKIESLSKGEDATGRAGEQIAIYFEHPKSGVAEMRCPAYVSLKVGQRAKFYVRLRKIGPEWRALLEMGSDVCEPPTKPAGA